MSMKTVAILSPGDMGHAVGRVLGEHGLDVVTCLQGRSERTRGLARQANIRDLPSLEELVAQSDLILSIVVPGEAVGVAQRVADALRATHADTLFADCNATAPQTAEAMNAIVTSAGGRFIDASVLGGPPHGDRAPRFYASGPHAGALAELDGKGIEVHLMGDTVGRASGLKMCNAALTKGMNALYTTVLAAAEAMGFSEELHSEILSRNPAGYQQFKAGILELPPKAHRYVSEMEEIAAAFEHVGVTPLLHRGAAEVFRVFAQSPFANETPETRDKNRTMEQTIAEFVECLPDKSA